MGWERVERVWMPEWVADPDAVVTRLVEAAGGSLAAMEDQAEQLEVPEADGGDEPEAMPSEDEATSSDPAPWPLS